MAVHISNTRIVRGACPQDCPDTCAFLYHVEDGKLVEVAGDPDHPMTRGGLCVKLKDYAEHHYNPDRLLYAMKRTGQFAPQLPLDYELPLDQELPHRSPTLFDEE